jgi:hypothetical protein
VTHDEWQEQVVTIAHTLGWSHLHVRRSVGKGRRWVTATNLRGWPDLTLFGPRGRGLVVAELKVRPDVPTADQEAVLAALREAGVDAFVWYPDDLDDVVRELSRRDRMLAGPALAR